VRLIDELHQLAGRVPVADLLKLFVDRTGYRAILLAADDARAARNVSKLLLDAQRSALVSTGAFLEYVRGLRKGGARESEARADSHGAVQLMSVHQAKGLEFPIVVIGDAASTGSSGRASVLFDSELGIVINLQSDAGAPLVWKLAQQRELSKETAESDRLLYVAATRARDRLLLSGHIGGVNKDGSLQLAGWLKPLCLAAGMGRLPDGFDPDGAAPFLLNLSIDGAAQGCGGALYPAEFVTDIASVAPPAVAIAPAPDTPLLLDAVQASADLVDATPPRVWRVVAVRRWAPAWVIGKLVHAALAAWRFPGEHGFDAWCRAQARRHGLDAVQLDHAVRRTRRLLANFHRHPLYVEIDAAEVRRHEIPYALAEDATGGAPAFGQLDLLFRSGAQWTVVDFKTDHLHDERARVQLLEGGVYQAQIERYLAAMDALLGARPRGLLCLLDDRGACSVVEIGAAQVESIAPPDALWTQAEELADPACAELLAACRRAGLPAPEIGCDIPDARGRVMTTAELAWPDARVAVFLPGAESALLLAGQTGWRTAFLEVNREDAVMRWLQEVIST